ncbi:MAG: tetratricopeptide repeat protein [Phycisphaerae bacterium]|nr:tetratricopeptide repeat protein [Phycisphaerae bacterium]
MEVFYQAQRAYEQGAQLTSKDPNEAERLLREASNGFQALVDDGTVNGQLYYDLANTYLRLKEVGRAILYYRKAEQLIPGDTRLKEGLRVARSIRRNDIPVAGQTALAHALLFWHYGSSVRGRATVGIVAYVLFWAAAIGATVVGHGVWRYALVVLAIVWVAMGVSVAVSAYEGGHTQEGVIVGDDVVVSKDPGIGSSPEFEEKLYQGVEFELLDRKSQWYFIQLPNGKSGWVPREAAALI